MPSVLETSFTSGALSEAATQRTPYVGTAVVLGEALLADGDPPKFTDQNEELLPSVDVALANMPYGKFGNPCGSRWDDDDGLNGRISDHSSFIAGSRQSWRPA
jgi:hypothetical protein